MAVVPNRVGPDRAVLGRMVLGACAVLSVVGGAALALRAVIYSSAGEHVPALGEFGWFGVFAGMCACALYLGGVFRVGALPRIGLAFGLTGAAHAVIQVVASLTSLLGDRGGQRGTLEDGTVGFLWLLAGACFAWHAANGRWPAARDRR